MCTEYLRNKTRNIWNNPHYISIYKMLRTLVYTECHNGKYLTPLYPLRTHPHSTPEIPENHLSNNELDYDILYKQSSLDTLTLTSGNDVNVMTNLKQITLYVWFIYFLDFYYSFEHSGQFLNPSGMHLRSSHVFWTLFDCLSFTIIFNSFFST